MVIGLKRGTVALADHDPEWETIAAQTIDQLWRIFGSAAKDIQHVGSTAIRHIKAKPIIDIAVAVDDFSSVEGLNSAVENAGFQRRHWETDEQMLFAAGDYSRPDGVVTHFIHVVKTDSKAWHNYLRFRDYLNANVFAAKSYEALKVKLAAENPRDKGREKYLAGKRDFIQKTLQDALIWACIHDIPGYDSFVKLEPVTKGWSGDKKYHIETVDGKQMLLRVSDIDELDRKKAEYNMMKRVYALGILTSEPLAFGLCHDGKSCYSLSGWLDGKDAKEVLPFLPETEQYVLGMNAGETLKKIHSMSAPDNVELWRDWFYRKVRSRMDFYNANPIKSENSDIIIRYLHANKHLLDSRPQAFCHGDFNLSNMMIMPDRQIGVIDFNAFNEDHGDPWWEFDPCMDGWGSEPLKHFNTGLINGYFNGNPPSEFFDVLSYYLAYDALAALCDTSIHNQGEPEVGRRHMENTLRWFDDLKHPIPSWYLKDCYIQWIDGVPYKLKAPFDFTFLSKYGKVFKVYDDQDSGNICFGIADGDKRYFVKFAGAPTERAGVRAETAITNLKRTVSVYQDLVCIVD